MTRHTVSYIHADKSRKIQKRKDTVRLETFAHKRETFQKVVLKVLALMPTPRLLSFMVAFVMSMGVRPGRGTLWD